MTSSCYRRPCLFHFTLGRRRVLLSCWPCVPVGLVFAVFNQPAVWDTNLRPGATARAASGKIGTSSIALLFKRKQGVDKIEVCKTAIKNPKRKVNSLCSAAVVAQMRKGEVVRWSALNAGLRYRCIRAQEIPVDTRHRKLPPRLASSVKGATHSIVTPPTTMEGEKGGTMTSLTLSPTRAPFMAAILLQCAL